MSAATAYLRPPSTRTKGGRARRVGLELEFGGLELGEAVDATTAVLGGKVRRHGPTKAMIETDDLGVFRIELDSKPLRDRAYLEPLRRWFDGFDQTPVAREIEDSVVRLASHIVPYELVTPPLRLDQLPRLDPVWDSLRAAGARGSDDSVVYAFGLQLNPDVWALEPASVFSTLQAYLVLEEWLLRSSNPNLSRRVTPFVNPFDPAFARQAVAAPPPASWVELVDFYVRANPTRNRPLDLLPIFRCASDRGLVDRGWLDCVDDPDLVKARPAFHYRLPDSRISQPGWTPAEAWNRWVLLERLAAEPKHLERLRREYLLHERPSWFERMRRFVEELVGS